MSSRNHRKVVDQVAAAGILQHAIDMQKARGTDVGSRVYAESAPGPTGDGAQTAAPAVRRHALFRKWKATVSPVNNDDSSGGASNGAGRPLTRKEIRAREKLLATQGFSRIPPQAFETGQDVPTPDPAPSALPPEGVRPAAPQSPEAAPNSLTRAPELPARPRRCTKKQCTLTRCTRKQRTPKRCRDAMHEPAGTAAPPAHTAGKYSRSPRRGSAHDPRTASAVHTSPRR